MRNQSHRFFASLGSSSLALLICATTLLASAAATLPVVVPPTLKFANWSIREIRDGIKTATVRSGTRTFPDGLIKAIGNGGETLILQNVTVNAKKVKNLTEADARANGSDSLDELKDDLSRDYPGISDDDLVSVISFHVSDASK